MKKFISLLLVVMLLFSVVLTGCSGEGEENPADNEEPNEENQNDSDESAGNDEESVEKDTLIIGLTADPGSFSPLDSTMMIELRLYENIYDTLVEVDLEGNIISGLAKSWDISEDGLTYEFKLHEGVKFHDGSELKAADVVYTFNELYTESANYFDLRQIYNEALAKDEYTVEITLNEPSAMFLAELASTGYVFSENYHTTVGDEMRSKPMGTGAYKFKSREMGSKIEFERFDDYFKGQAPIKNVVYRILPDANTLVVALESGDIDFSDSIPLASKSILEENSDISLQSLQGIRLDWVAMNNESEPFDNVKVRQAVNYALDREFWNDVVFEGEGTPWDAMFLPGMIAAPDDYPKYEYNVEKAKDLLEEAGYPDGFTVEQPILCTAAQSQPAEVLQASLMNIGIITEIQTLEFGTYISQYRAGDFSLSISGFFFITPDTNLPSSVYKIGQIGVMNNARYVNEEVDSLLAEALVESDASVRRELYNEAYTIAQNDAAYAVAIIPPAIIGYDSNLSIDNVNSRNIRLYNFSWN